MYILVKQVTVIPTQQVGITFLLVSLFITFPELAPFFLSFFPQS